MFYISKKNMENLLAATKKKNARRAGRRFKKTYLCDVELKKQQEP